MVAVQLRRAGAVMRPILRTNARAEPGRFGRLAARLAGLEINERTTREDAHARVRAAVLQVLHRGGLRGT